MINDKRYIIAYDIRTGFIDAFVPNMGYAFHYPKDLKDNLRSLILDEIPDNLFEHRVINGELIKMSKLEINELREFGEILSEETRVENTLLDKLKPPPHEIHMAKQTIQVLGIMEGLI